MTFMTRCMAILVFVAAMLVSLPARSQPTQFYSVPIIGLWTTMGHVHDSGTVECSVQTRIHTHSISLVRNIFDLKTKEKLSEVYLRFETKDEYFGTVAKTNIPTEIKVRITFEEADGKKSVGIIAAIVIHKDFAVIPAIQPEFVARFAMSKTVKIEFEGGPMFHLNLSGTLKQIEEISKCIAASGVAGKGGDAI